MKKTLTSVAVVAALGFAASAQAVTINWTTNLEAGNAVFPSADPLNSAAFGTLAGAANPDFRVMTGGAVSGGGEKAIASGVSWDFNGGNQLALVTGSNMTPGAPVYCAPSGCSAAPAGDVGAFKNALFLGVPFGFLAPTVGSAAGTTHGVMTINYGAGDSFTMFAPVMEAQWNMGNFNIGKSNGGVTFNCTGAQTGSIECFAETQLVAADDTLGFAGQYMQWHLTGSATPFAVVNEVPVPAAAWLLGSGLMGLVGVARRRKAS